MMIGWMIVVIHVFHELQKQIQKLIFRGGGGVAFGLRRHCGNTSSSSCCCCGRRIGCRASLVVVVVVNDG